MPSAQAISAMIRAHGEPMTLTKVPTGETVAVYVKEFTEAVSDLVGDIQQGARSFKFTNLEIAAAGWPGPPRKYDTLTTADNLVYAIESADTRRDGQTVLLHIVRAKGDA